MSFQKKIEKIFHYAQTLGLCMDPETAEMLSINAPICVGCSGGKDSATFAIVTDEFLKLINHRGPKLLIHSDLGIIEHADSLPACRRLAEKIGWELIVVKPRIDMIGRWYQRQRDNTMRYTDLSCVKMITPWSSASLRFCTGELKITPICSELKKRFPGQPILNAVGIRAEESAARAKKPISKENKKLTVKTLGTYGRDWFGIRDYPVERVWLAQRKVNFCGHEAYDKNGNKRVSCSVCVLAGADEIRASLRDERNHQAYLRVVELEIISTYSFSQSFWAGDVAPELLSAKMRDDITLAKEKTEKRILIESDIPDDLFYEQGWPNFQPNRTQSELIADVRRRIGELMSIPVSCTRWREVHLRYADLLHKKAIKQAEQERKKARQAARIAKDLATAVIIPPAATIEVAQYI